MIRSKRMFTGLLIATVVPGTLGAQTITQSFGDLQQVLKVNQLIVVTDETGEKTKGRVVANVSTSSLTPQVKATKRNPQGTQTLHRQYGLNDRASIRSGALLPARRIVPLAIVDDSPLRLHAFRH